MTYCKVGSHTNAAATLTYGRYKNGKKRENIVIDAINCSPETAKEEFALVRNLYGKNNGVQIHTIIQSFSDEDNLTMEQVNKIGTETAKRICPGHQAVIITHQDGVGGKKHNHIMFSAVNFETGQKFNNHALLYRVREVSDEICKEHGLKTIPHDNPTKFEEKLKSRGEKPWKDKLREIINEAKSIAKNLDEFQQYLKKEGITINERNSRKECGQAWTYIVTRDDWGLKERKIRGRTLGDDFTYAKIRQCVNKPKATQTEDVKPISTPKPKQDMPHNAFDFIRQKSKKIKNQYNQDLANILSYCSPIERKIDIVFEDDKPKMVEIPYKDPFYGKDIKQNLAAIKMIAVKDFDEAAKHLSPETMMRYVVNLYGTDSQTLFDAVNAITNIKNETPNFTGQLLQDTLKLPEYKQAYNHKGQGVWSSISKLVVTTGRNGKGNGRGTVSRVITGRSGRSSVGGNRASAITNNTRPTQKRGEILSKIINKITGKGDKYARLDVPKIQKQWTDDWAWLSEAEKAEIRANLDNLDRY